MALKCGRLKDVRDLLSVQGRRKRMHGLNAGYTVSPRDEPFYAPAGERGLLLPFAFSPHRGCGAHPRFIDPRLFSGPGSS